MNRATRLLAALIATGLIAVASGRATFAAFTSTTANPANAIASGTVVIADNDAGNVMWNVTNQLPTSPAVVRCIRVTYSGTLPATVRLYTTTAASTLDPYLNVTVEKGTMPAATTFSNCTGFVAQATIFPTATLQAFKAARRDGRTVSPRSRGRRPPGTPPTPWSTDSPCRCRTCSRPRA